MPLEGLRWSRDSGSALYDTPPNGRSRTGWGVGFTINSLKELPIRLKNISTEKYSAMLTKVKQLAIAINNGDNLKKAIEESKL